MNSIRNARFLHISGLVLSVLVWLANSNNPTNGRTGAPFDGHCNSCHDGNNPGGFNGTVEVTGLPNPILPNTVYPLTITLTPTAGSPVRGGFQLVAVDGNNADAGDLATLNTQTGTEMSGGREYIEHRGAKNFTGGGPASWNFNWTSPGVAPGGTITFYYVGNFGNNNNSDSGDRPIEGIATYTFNGPTEPVSASISTFSNVTCNGGNNGSITVQATGGTAPYTYAWNNGQTGATASNLTAGTYTVTVTGASGSGTATATKTLTQPAAMNVTVSANGTITCAQPTVSVSATVQGGATPYSYQWSNNTTGAQTTYAQGGAYTVIVTDNNGCSRTATGTISTNTTTPTATIVTPPTITCSTPTITLSGTGSTTGATITYAWTATGGGSIVSGANTLNPTVNSCGNYTLLVTNTANGCTASATRAVICNTAPPSATATGGTITCNSPTVTLNASSTTPNVTYSWVGPCINASNQNLKNPVVCVAGAYTVTITNPVNGCTNTATASVTENTVIPTVPIASPAVITCATPVVTLSASGTGNVTYSWTGPCFTSSTQIANPQVCEPGTYTVVATNTTNGCTSSNSVTVQSDVVIPTAEVAPPEHLNCNNTVVQLDGTGSSTGAEYTYEWSTTSGNILSGNNALIATADQEGPYRFVVTNTSNGCTSEVLVNVVESDPVTASATSSAALCAGTPSGSAAVTPGGGTAPYTFVWSNGSTNSIATGLIAGTYTVTVTDTDGCTAAASTVVTEPTALQLAVTTTAQTAVNLNDGTASASASGGTPGYTYAWSTGATTSALSNLAPGSITVTVTDANGCTATQIANVNSYNCNLNATISSTAASCSNGANGSATVAVSGATEPITYAWSNSASTATTNGLAAGIYTVSVTDFAGCPLVLSTMVSAPPPITINIVTVNESAVGAADGSAMAQVSGGTDSYSYLWSTGAVTASIGPLVPGTYTVVVTDENGCTSQQTALVQSISCDLATELVVTPVKCFNTPSGTASSFVTGAVGDVTYIWSNGATTEIVENLNIGTITVTVTDGVGCSTVSEADIVGPASALEVQVVNITGVPCPQDQSGSATPAIAGGWGQPYTFQFSWGVGGFSDFPAGTYSFTVTDAGGCSVVAGFNIEVLDDTPPLVVCPDNMVLCGANLFDYPTPQVIDNCGGNLAPTLMSGLASGSIFLDGVSTQVFMATDASGNTGTCSFDVVVYPISDILIDSVQNDVGGASTGAIFVQIVGESGPYTYQWIRNGEVVANTEDLTGVFTGTYTLIATDINGCTVQLAPVFVDNVVGTDNPASLAAKIKLWPNPAGNSFRVEMNGFETSDISILNAQGRLVRTLQPTEWNDAIEVSELPTGFYYLKVIGRNGHCQVVKWVKGE